MGHQIPFGKTSDQIEVGIDLSMANRHGLIAGATGTGKTVTLQKLAETFSSQGVPVFTADIKGDLSGLCEANPKGEKIVQRLEKLKLSAYTPCAAPVCFWDLLGKNGLPVRATISEFGPLLLARLLDLNEVQTGVLQIAFRVADEEDLLIIDLKDLRAVLNFISDNANEIQTTYGNVAAATVGAIQRRLLSLEEAGAGNFFGEPALKLSDLMLNSEDGRGIINILDATQLIENSRLYSTFLLWLLSELFEELPEAGDLSKPKLVFFFDEAHLLFDDAPAALVDKIEMVVRLIRSKGVGVYFVTQSPADIPTKVLGQLGNRVQHALRAYTPADTKLLKSAADNFRANEKFSTADAISELEIGEALVSCLDAKGIPSVVERAFIFPPQSKLGPGDETLKQTLISSNQLAQAYRKSVDQYSAFEALQEREDQQKATSASNPKKKAEPARRSTSGRRQGFAETFFKSVLRSFGSKTGQAILRGILGSVTKGSRR